MSNDLDHDLREMFLRHEADLAGLRTAPPDIVSRVRRRQARTAFMAIFVAIALTVAAVPVGVAITRSSDTRPADQPEQQAPTAAQLATNPYLLDLETGEATPLPENLEGGYAYAASPDGTRLAYAPAARGGCAGPGLITVANVDGTGVRSIESPGALTLCAPRWSPDGTKLVYQARDGEDGAGVGRSRVPWGSDVGNLFVYDLATGGTTQVTDLELTDAWHSFLAPSFSADGQQVLFHLPRSSSPTTRWDVWSVPVAGGEPTLVLRNATFPIDRGFGPEGLLIQFLLPNADDFAGQSLMTGRPTPDADIRFELAEANESIWWPTLSPDKDRIAYQDGGFIYVVDIYPGSARREPLRVANGSTAEWLDNDTLIVTP